LIACTIALSLYTVIVTPSCDQRETEGGSLLKPLLACFLCMEMKVQVHTFIFFLRNQMCEGWNTIICNTVDNPTPLTVLVWLRQYSYDIGSAAK